MIKKSLIAICMTFFASAAHAGDIYIKAGAWLDVASGERIPDQVIVVSGNKIIAIGPQDELLPGQGDRVIDLGDKTLLPGLMDMHVHLGSDPDTNYYEKKSFSTARKTVIAVKNARKTLMAGFTSVRNLGSSGYSVIGVRDGINAGDIPGPRIWSAGNSVGILGGHCDENFYAPEVNYRDGGVADGPWAVREKVRENIKYGADAIKVCATGGVFSKGTKVGAQQMTLDEMKAAVGEAHLRGLTIAAHAHGTSGIKDAIRAGVDSIEHCSFMDSEAIGLAVKSGTYLSCDIYNTEYTLAYGEANGVPEENINKEKQVSAAQRDSFRRAVKAGARMVFGSDAAIYPHGDNGKQFSRMVRFGMTPLQAIRAATTESAALMGESERLGQIKVGYLADIIAVDGNPLDDIDLLENVRFVMKDGTVYKEAGQ